jgi:MFS superfamily sulfate permease-like transporter
MARVPFQTDAEEARVAPWTWSWLKQWTGYLVTVLPYVSAGLVLIPQLGLWPKAAILAVFTVLVLAIRVVHEKSGIEITGDDKRGKRPRALR